MEALSTITPPPDVDGALAALGALATAAANHPPDEVQIKDVDPDPSTVNFERRDALVERLRVDDVPVQLAKQLSMLRDLAAHGTPYLAAVAYLERDLTLTATERSALEAAVYYRPIGESGDAHLPEVDVDDLFKNSPVVIEQINCVAEGVHVHRDLMVLGALAAASTTLARKVAIQLPGDGWITYPNLHVVVEAGSGRGKGPMTKRMGCLTTILNWQKDLVARFGGTIRVRGLMHELLKDDRAVKFKEAKKARQAGSTSEYMALLATVADLDRRIEEPVPEQPWFVVNDVTPQRFVDMCHASGFVMLCHGEGKVLLKQFTGKSDSSDGLGALLASWSVEEQQRDRVGNAAKPRVLDGLVASTCLLPLQRGVLAPTTPEDQALLRDIADRGAFGRWIIARPRCVDIDESEDIVPDSGETRDIQARYDALLVGLCESAIDLDPVRPLAPAVPAIAAVDPDAEFAFLNFQRKYKAQANPGGPMEDGFREPIAMKLGEQALRIAAVIAALRVRTFGADGYRITLDDWERAARFTVKYILPHALACCSRISLTEVGVDANELSRVLSERGPTTKSALRRGPFNTWDKKRNDRKSRFEDAYETAVEKGLIIPENRPRGQIMVHAVRGAA